MEGKKSKKRMKNIVGMQLIRKQSFEWKKLAWTNGKTAT